MTDITTTKQRDLVSTENLAFIRDQVVRIDVSNIRPLTRLFPFFNGVRVDDLVKPLTLTSTQDPTLPADNTPDDGGLAQSEYGDPLVSNSIGRLVALFHIPSATFPTGDIQFVLSDTENIADLDIEGNTYGQATATFSTKGVLEKYQTTVTNTTTRISNVIRYTSNIDPLAQSFFTYGVKGGICITSLDLYFQSKDPSINVTVEIRPLVNGVPGPISSTNPANFTVTLDPSRVNISNDASVATNFKFNTPIYLAEDGDYCFVVRSNSNKYNLWTSRMGESSIETGYTIYEQPYVGSLFKSENNITWTAEQFEDIKFTLYKAKFNTQTSATVSLNASAPYFSVTGDLIKTVSGSNAVIVSYPQKHALTIGSKVAVSVPTGTTFNGIPAPALNGEFFVTRIIDDYSIEFLAGANATSSGIVGSSGVLTGLRVLNPGVGYTTGTIAIQAPGSGTTATATVKVVNGGLVVDEITNIGNGYTTVEPNVVVSGDGSGASFAATTAAVMTISKNASFDWVSPKLTNFIPDGTQVEGKLTNGIGFNYAFAQDVDVPPNAMTLLPSTRLVAAPENENNFLGGAKSFQYQLQLFSNNSNVSPMLDLRDKTLMVVTSNAINKQVGENVSIGVNSATGSVQSANITGGGSGYSGAPTVTVVPAPNDINIDKIVPASITATVSGGTVNGITVVSGGSGYTKTPTLMISPPASGITATAKCGLTAFNTELMTRGTSDSRYLTRRMNVQMVSTGIRVFATVQSGPETSVDWYVRTSLSSDGIPHESYDWKLMKCDEPRGKSSNNTQFFEYEFFLDNLNQFDTYDLKMVPSSSIQSKFPSVLRWRAIVTA